MSKPDSWMPLYVGDYIADTMHLNTEEHGAYLLLLLTAWNRGGRLPNNDAQLALICRADKKAWARIKGSVLPFFNVDGEFLVQSRLMAEYENSKRIYATKVANGQKGGRKSRTEKEPAGSGSLNPPDTRPGEQKATDGGADGGTQPQPQRQEPNTPNERASTTQQVSTSAGRVCARLRSAGITGVNPSRPDLRNLLEAGVAEDEIAGVGEEEKSRGKSMAWLMAAVIGRRQAAAEIDAGAQPVRKAAECCFTGCGGKVAGTVSGRHWCRDHQDYAMDASNFRKAG